jgi:hypothetical protein
MISRSVHRLLPLTTRTTLLTTAPSALTTRSYLTRTPLNLAPVTKPVPTMGDSITEGTIVEWLIPIGGQVADGEVICLIETDKVTVDIKADCSGVITQQFGGVDDTVEVGKDLYIIDSEGTASTTTVAPAAPVQAAAAPAPVAAAAAPQTDNHSHGRKPSIHFKGKAGWYETLHPSSTSSQSSTPSSSPSSSALNNVSLALPPNYNPMFGRPVISDEEIEALMSGGADISPQMIKMSGGSEFK